MPTGFGLNRGRLQLTGLEEPEELWERLKESTTKTQAVEATNRKLASRVRMLEKQLSEVGGLTDDELVAELPKRMTRALESAQAVASEIVGRARKQEAAIRKEAAEAAAEIVQQAEHQAASMLHNAATQANANIVSAEGKAQEILRAAQAQRRDILADLAAEAEAIQRRIDTLQYNQGRLMHAYQVVQTTLVEAKRALSDGAAEAPVDPAQAPRHDRSGVDASAGRKRPRQSAPVLKVYNSAPPAASAG